MAQAASMRRAAIERAHAQGRLASPAAARAQADARANARLDGVTRRKERRAETRSLARSHTARGGVNSTLSLGANASQARSLCSVWETLAHFLSSPKESVVKKRGVQH